MPPLLRGHAILLALLALHLLQPLGWGRAGPDLWYPAAGLGFALLAWIGPRAGWLILISNLLVVVHGTLAGALPTPEGSLSALGGPIAECLLGVAALEFAWWIYFKVAKGTRGFADPRSAVLYLLLVPGLAAGAFGLARAGLAQVAGSDWSFARSLAIHWLNWALGLLIVAPPLLAILTPWLERWYLVGPEARANDGPGKAPAPLVDDPRLGDWIEIVGLAVGASTMGLLLAWTQGMRELAGWQLWGAPQLLIFWASLRQGIRGGALVAGVAAGVPLLALSTGHRGDIFTFLLQSNLLAQCSTGLLVAASASWIRASEHRFRHAVSHTPVVLYSARLSPSGPGRPPSAEITMVSAATSTVLGCPPDRLIGNLSRWLAIVHPDDRVVLQAAVTQLDRQSLPVTCEYRLSSASPDVPSDSGSGRPSHVSHPNDAPVLPPRAPVKWVRDTLAPHYDPDGRVIGWEGVVVDITEQRALADDLRRTTSMFHALVSNLPAGVFFVQGPRGRPILVNARARELLGQREDAAAGLEHIVQIFRLHHADGTPFPTEQLPVYQALRYGTTTMRDDIVVHRPDGRRTPLVSWAAPVHLSGGSHADAAVWVIEDLTALRQAEAARHETEVRLQTVVETMGEGLILHDRLGEIVECNPAACSLLGRDAAGLRGRSSIDLGWSLLREDGSSLPPESAPVQLVLRRGKPVRQTVVGLRSRNVEADASVRWLLVNAMPLGPIGQITGVVTTFSDITAHRSAQEVLRQSEEKYRGLVESLPLMLIQLDRDLRITYANPAFRAVSGFDVHDIDEPALWKAQIDPEDLTKVQRGFAEALRGIPSQYESKFTAKDGTERHAYAMLRPRYRGDRVIGVSALVVDTTRERSLERELQRAQRLELIGRLSSGIAHDFNNMLTVILSCADQARSLLPAEHGAQKELRRVNDAAEQAANLAGQLLAFSKQRRLVCKRVEVNGVARRTLDLLRPTLPAGVTVAEELDRLDLFIHADETQLQQVLMNLCLNARDAMPNGGEIHLRTRMESTQAKGEATRTGWVRVTVRDTGEGIHEKVKARIFDPFFSTKERGTGLGLAVVQQIVESFGGRVEVVSDPGAGAQFEVWLPSFEA